MREPSYLNMDYVKFQLLRLPFNLIFGIDVEILQKLLTRAELVKVQTKNVLIFRYKYNILPVKVHFFKTDMQRYITITMLNLLILIIAKVNMNQQKSINQTLINKNVFH